MICNGKGTYGMNKNRMAIIFAVALLISLMCAQMPAAAERKDAAGFVTSKTVKENSWTDQNTISDYTITIDAYATGKSVTEDDVVPCDIIMVLDTTRSMTSTMYIYKKVDPLDVKTDVAYYALIDNAYTTVRYCSDCEAFAQPNNWYGHQAHTTKYKPTGASGYSADAVEVDFYTGTSTNTTRLQALKTSCNSFIAQIAERALDTAHNGENKVDHRIAAIRYYADASTVFELTDMSVEGNLATVQQKITDMGYNPETDTEGALQAAIDMINGIDAATKEKYIKGERNLVVILFTDGAPNYISTGSADEETAMNAAIAKAKLIKNNGYNTTLYAIGVFDGADASQAQVASTDSNMNKFLKLVSSNYPQATSLTNTGSIVSPLSGSYYLTAETEEKLKEAFANIATQASGGRDIALDATTYVKDVLTEQFVLPEGCTEDDIKVYTVDCTGADANGNLTFGTTKTEFNATIETGTDAATGRTYVKVNNFDYAENYCGTVTQDGITKYRGKKLIIEIPVNVKNGFVGGNNVATNESTSAVYKLSTTAGESDTLIEELDEPQVNVPVMDITVETPKRNVYLYGDLTYTQLLDGASGTADDVTVTLSRERHKYDFTNKKQVAYTDSVAFDIDDEANNYGLAAWQTAYVKITGDSEESFSDLTADKTYAVDCTIAPSAAAETGSVGTEAASKIGSSTGDVNVFKPVMTFKDTSVKYGKTASENTDAAVSTWDAYYEKYNYVSTEWKHGDTVSTAVTMIGTEPTLTRTYTADSANFDSGKVNTKDDIAVNVTVELGTINKIDITKLNFVTFKHEDCDVDGCAFKAAEEEFLLHVSGTVGRLTITKSGLTESTESAVFEVTSVSDSTKTWTVVINGNGSVTLSELPAGEYTIKEKDAWTWRYSSLPDKTVTVPAGGEVKAEFENTRSTDKWLGGDNYADNVFGKATGGN